MKTGKWLMLVCIAGLSGACRDDGRDDTVLDMSLLTGKDWYYNGWLGDKDAYEAKDLLEVLHFEEGGVLKSIDFGGRREYVAGRWSADENNRITMEYVDGGETVWNVQRSGTDYIRTVVNAQGVREYTTKPDYLGGLTADAFWVNEYTSGNVYKTYVGADVRGNINLREGQLLLADGSRVALQNHEFFWSGKSPVHVGQTGQAREVRFYLRLGRNNQLKLRDSIYADNLPGRTVSETDLNIREKGGTLHVTWNPYPEERVFYKVEVLSEGLDLTAPYFVSRIQHAGCDGLEVHSTTAGEVNRMGELRSGNRYTVRLTALLYEPGIDSWNDRYGYANVQAVAYFVKDFLKE